MVQRVVDPQPDLLMILVRHALHRRHDVDGEQHEKSCTKSKPSGSRGRQVLVDEFHDQVPLVLDRSRG